MGGARIAGGVSPGQGGPAKVLLISNTVLLIRHTADGGIGATRVGVVRGGWGAW